MLLKLVPDMLKKTIYDIDFPGLIQRGIKGIVFDLDNTVAPYAVPDPTPQVALFFDRLAGMGLKVGIVSNNRRSRVERFCRTLNVLTFPDAQKPRRKGLRYAASVMGLKNREIAVVGDQLFTDVLAANRAGMLSVLVEPIEKKESLFFKLKRALEKPIINYYNRQERDGR